MSSSSSQYIYFTFPEGSSIPDNSSLYAQLQEDANVQLNSTNLQVVDSFKWDFISNEIGLLVDAANQGDISAEEKSQIYGRIMIIITAQYLPIVSDFLGDQIAEQASIQDLSSDVSDFLAQGQNAFNALSSASWSNTNGVTCETTGCATTATETEKQDLFSGVMSLTGYTTGANDSSRYNYSFIVNRTITNPFTGESITENIVEPSVLAFLTDTRIWGDITPLGTEGKDQINSAMQDIIDIYNSGESKTVSSSWLNEELDNIASATLVWTQPYGASSLDATYGSTNAPLVYTDPNSIQSAFNQGTQAVQTVATSAQTIENFQIQEIDQYYGITNSIQSSQQQQCSSMVKKQIV